MKTNFICSKDHYRTGSQLVRLSYASLHTLQLGTGSLKQRNRALLLKWLSRFTQEDRSLRRSHCDNKWGSVMNGAKGSARGKSWVVINIGTVLWRLWSSKLTMAIDQFWEDAWVMEAALSMTFSEFYALSSKKEAFITDCWRTESQAWDLGIRRR